MKKTIFAVLTLGICSLATNAQFLEQSKERFSSPILNDFQEMAIDGAMMPVESTFRIRDIDTDKVYGYKGNDVFGKQKSVAILTDRGYIVNELVVCPWENDANFEKYRKKSYEPVPYRLKVGECSAKENADSVCTQFEITDSTFTKIGDSAFYFLTDTIPAGGGFRITAPKDTLNGWCVWMIADKDGNISTKFTNYKVNFSSKEEYFDINEPNLSGSDSEIVGAFFIYPSPLRTGALEFCLPAMGVNVDGTWKITRIDTTGLLEEEPDDPEKEGEDPLTPVENLV